MRRTAKQLGEVAFDCRTWWQAQQAAKGITREKLSDKDQEELLQQQADEYADRMAKAFSTKLATNTDLAARGLLPSILAASCRSSLRRFGHMPREVIDDPEAEF